MPSVTDICNTALSHIGKPTISDMLEESEEARQCKLHYVQTRDALVQSYPWHFATKVVVLGQVTNDWQQRYQFAYQRPTDCLKITRLIPECDLKDNRLYVPYEVRANAIYCDLSPASLEFISRIDDPTKFPPLFVEALAWALAAKIVMPLTRDQALRKDAYQLATSAADSARASDANEEPNMWAQPESDAAWHY